MQRLVQFYTAPAHTVQDWKNRTDEVNELLEDGWEVKAIVSTPLDSQNSILTQIVLERKTLAKNISVEKQDLIDAAEDLSKVKTFATANLGTGTMADMLKRNLPNLEVWEGCYISKASETIRIAASMSFWWSTNLKTPS